MRTFCAQKWTIELYTVEDNECAKKKRWRGKKEKKAGEILVKGNRKTGRLWWESAPTTIILFIAIFSHELTQTMRVDLALEIVHYLPPRQPFPSPPRAATTFFVYNCSLDCTLGNASPTLAFCPSGSCLTTTFLQPANPPGRRLWVNFQHDKTRPTSPRLN